MTKKTPMEPSIWRISYLASGSTPKKEQNDATQRMKHFMHKKDPSTLRKEDMLHQEQSTSAPKEKSSQRNKEESANVGASKKHLDLQNVQYVRAKLKEQRVAQYATSQSHQAKIRKLQEISTLC